MEQNTKTLNSIVIAIVALVLIGSGAYLYVNRKAGGPVTGTATTTAATSTVIHTDQGDITIPGNFKIEQVPIAERPKPPVIARPLAFSSSVSASEKTRLQAMASEQEAILNKSPYDARAWTNLGTIRMNAGDYEGARQAWNYVVAVSPTSPKGYFNLATLYKEYLRDYKKAESNYLNAIALLPTDTTPYRALFELYTQTSYKPSAVAAENILKKGIAANSKAVDLQVMLARYYVQLGRTSDARAEFEAAIQNAEAQKLTSLASQIKEELAALK